VDGVSEEFPFNLQT